MRPNEVTASNISLISRHNLENVYLERERTRDAAIGLAFCAGVLSGGALVAVLIGWVV